MFGFLQHEGDPIDAPAGGDFQPSGYIAPWLAIRLYMVMGLQVSPDDVKEEGIDVTSWRKAGEWHCFYFRDYDAASELGKYIGSDRNPNSVWVFQAKVDDILNLNPEKRDKFRDTLTWELSVKTPKSKKYRHELHFIGLPAIVRAVAVNLGYDVPALDFGPLLSDDTAFTDEFYEKMAGDPDDGFRSDSVMQSALMQQRAGLWKALGENDPWAYRLKGSEGRYVTEADRLNQCLSPFYWPWTTTGGAQKPELARLVPVLDPRIDALNSNGDRLKLPIITEFFGSEEKARAAAEVDLNQAGGSTDTTAATTTTTTAPPGGLPAVPGAWTEYPDEWVASVKEIKVIVESRGTPPAIALRGMTEELQNKYMVTPAEVLAWLPHV